VPVALLLALGSGLCWGTADFFGGLQSRKLPALTVVFWSQLCGGLSLWLGLLAFGAPLEPATLVGGMLAGLFAAGGLVMFYRGLAVGAMSIVAPISACGSALPVAVSLARGEVPSALALGGVAVAMLGIVLVSMPSGSTPHPSGQPGLVLLLSLGAALGFGGFFVLIDQAVEGAAAPLWAVAGTRTASLPVVLALSLLGGRRPAWPGRRILNIGPIGLADAGANGLFTIASQLGNLGLVSVLASLYPVATVLLAFVILRERLAGVHWAGVGLALMGVGLMAAG
jgi:drug/metabolite transporter (DMT)-like permease